MPYTSVAQVPSYVPEAKKKQWMEVFNSAYAAAKKDGKSDEEAEQSAFAQANGVAGPSSGKAAWPSNLVKIGTPETGFVRGIHGPFKCGHCEHMSDEGFCLQKDVLADPDVPHDDQGRVPVSKQDCCNNYDPILGTETVSTQEKLRKRMEKFKKFVPFVKIDETKRQVFGIVTAEVPDKDDEVCDYEKSKPYYQAVIAEFTKATAGQNFFPLREMHQLTAAGKCISFDFRDSEKEIYMGFEVVDDEAWKKVQKRVYTGFSQGGSMVGDLIPDPVYKGCMRYVADPSEVSLVDNPCLGVAHFAMVKADGSVEIHKHKSVSGKKAIKKNENGCDCACDNCVSNNCMACTNEECDDSDCRDCPMQARFGAARKVAKMKKRHTTLQHAFRKAARVWVNKYHTKLGKKTIKHKAQTLSGPVAIDTVKMLVKLSKPTVSKDIVTKGRQATFLKIDDDLGRRLQKGMCEVSCMAEVIEHLCYIFHMVVNEQLWEGDDSQVPATLRGNIEELVSTFLEYVTEETDELKEDIAARLAGEQAAVAVG